MATYETNNIIEVFVIGKRAMSALEMKNMSVDSSGCYGSSIDLPRVQ